MPKGRGKKQQSEEIKQSSEPDSDRAELMELSNREFEVTMINMSSALMERVDNTQIQMGNVK